MFNKDRLLADRTSDRNSSDCSTFTGMKISPDIGNSPYPAPLKSISKYDILHSYFECNFTAETSRRIAQEFKRQIKSCNKDPIFIEELRNKIIFLHNYNIKVAKVSITYPLSTELAELLMQYVLIESKTLYRRHYYTGRKEVNAQERILRLLLQIYNAHFGSKSVPSKKIFEKSAKAIINMFIEIRRDYELSNTLLENMTKILLKKMGHLEKIEALRGKRLPCPLDTYLRNDPISEVYKNTTTSDYGTDDGSSNGFQMDDEPDDVQIVTETAHPSTETAEAVGEESEHSLTDRRSPSLSRPILTICLDYCGPGSDEEFECISEEVKPTAKQEEKSIERAKRLRQIEEQNQKRARQRLYRIQEEFRERNHKPIRDVKDEDVLKIDLCDSDETSHGSPSFSNEYAVNSEGSSHKVHFSKATCDSVTFEISDDDECVQSIMKEKFEAVKAMVDNECSISHSTHRQDDVLCFDITDDESSILVEENQGQLYTTFTKKMACDIASHKEDQNCKEVRSEESNPLLFDKFPEQKSNEDSDIEILEISTGLKSMCNDNKLLQKISVLNNQADVIEITDDSTSDKETRQDVNNMNRLNTSDEGNKEDVLSYSTSPARGTNNITQKTIRQENLVNSRQKSEFQLSVGTMNAPEEHSEDITSGIVELNNSAVNICDLTGNGDHLPEDTILNIETSQVRGVEDVNEENIEFDILDEVSALKLVSGKSDEISTRTYSELISPSKNISTWSSEQSQNIVLTSDGPQLSPDMHEDSDANVEVHSTISQHQNEAPLMMQAIPVLGKDDGKSPVRPHYDEMEDSAFSNNQPEKSDLTNDNTLWNSSVQSNISVPCKGASPLTFQDCVPDSSESKKAVSKIEIRIPANDDNTLKTPEISPSSQNEAEETDREPVLSVTSNIIGVPVFSLDESKNVSLTTNVIIQESNESTTCEESTPGIPQGHIEVSGIIINISVIEENGEVSPKLPNNDKIDTATSMSHSKESLGEGKSSVISVNHVEASSGITTISTSSIKDEIAAQDEVSLVIPNNDLSSDDTADIFTVRSQESTEYKESSPTILLEQVEISSESNGTSDIGITDKLKKNDEELPEIPDENDEFASSIDKLDNGNLTKDGTCQLSVVESEDHETCGEAFSFITTDQVEASSENQTISSLGNKGTIKTSASSIISEDQVVVSTEIEILTNEDRIKEIDKKSSITPDNVATIQIGDQSESIKVTAVEFDQSTTCDKIYSTASQDQIEVSSEILLITEDHAVLEGRRGIKDSKSCKLAANVETQPCQDGEVAELEIKPDHSIDENLRETEIRVSEEQISLDCTYKVQTGDSSIVNQEEKHVTGSPDEGSKKNELSAHIGDMYHSISTGHDIQIGEKMEEQTETTNPLLEDHFDDISVSEGPVGDICISEDPVKDISISKDSVKDISISDDITEEVPPSKNLNEDIPMPVSHVEIEDSVEVISRDHLESFSVEKLSPSDRLVGKITNIDSSTEICIQERIAAQIDIEEHVNDDDTMFEEAIIHEVEIESSSLQSEDEDKLNILNTSEHLQAKHGVEANKTLNKTKKVEESFPNHDGNKPSQLTPTHSFSDEQENCMGTDMTRGQSDSSEMKLSCNFYAHPEIDKLFEKYTTNICDLSVHRMKSTAGNSNEERNKAIPCDISQTSEPLDLSKSPSPKKKDSIRRNESCSTLDSLDSQDKEIVNDLNLHSEEIVSTTKSPENFSISEASNMLLLASAAEEVSKELYETSPRIESMNIREKSSSSVTKISRRKQVPKKLNSSKGENKRVTRSQTTNPLYLTSFSQSDVLSIKSYSLPTANKIYTQKVSEFSFTSEESNDSESNRLMIDEDICSKSSGRNQVRKVVQDEKNKENSKSQEENSNKFSFQGEENTFDDILDEKLHFLVSSTSAVSASNLETKDNSSQFPIVEKQLKLSHNLQNITLDISLSESFDDIDNKLNSSRFKTPGQRKLYSMGPNLYVNINRIGKNLPSTNEENLATITADTEINSDKIQNIMSSNKFDSEVLGPVLRESDKNQVTDVDELPLAERIKNDSKLPKKNKNTMETTDLKLFDSCLIASSSSKEHIQKSGSEIKNYYSLPKLRDKDSLKKLSFSQGDADTPKIDFDSGSENTSSPDKKYLQHPKLRGKSSSTSKMDSNESIWKCKKNTVSPTTEKLMKKLYQPVSLFPSDIVVIESTEKSDVEKLKSSDTEEANEGVKVLIGDEEEITNENQQIEFSKIHNESILQKNEAEVKLDNCLEEKKNISRPLAAEVLVENEKSTSDDNINSIGENVKISILNEAVLTPRRRKNERSKIIPTTHKLNSHSKSLPDNVCESAQNRKTDDGISDIPKDDQVRNQIEETKRNSESKMTENDIETAILVSSSKEATTVEKTILDNFERIVVADSMDQSAKNDDFDELSVKYSEKLPLNIPIDTLTEANEQCKIDKSGKKSRTKSRIRSKSSIKESMENDLIKSEDIRKKENDSKLKNSNNDDESKKKSITCEEKRLRSHSFKESDQDIAEDLTNISTSEITSRSKGESSAVKRMLVKSERNKQRQISEDKRQSDLVKNEAIIFSESNKNTIKTDPNDQFSKNIGKEQKKKEIKKDRSKTSSRLPSRARSKSNIKEIGQNIETKADSVGVVKNNVSSRVSSAVKSHSSFKRVKSIKEEKELSEISTSITQCKSKEDSTMGKEDMRILKGDKDKICGNLNRCKKGFKEALDDEKSKHKSKKTENIERSRSKRKQSCQSTSIGDDKVLSPTNKDKLGEKARRKSSSHSKSIHNEKNEQRSKSRSKEYIDIGDHKLRKPQSKSVSREKLNDCKTLDDSVRCINDEKIIPDTLEIESKRRKSSSCSKTLSANSEEMCSERKSHGQYSKSNLEDEKDLGEHDSSKKTESVRDDEKYRRVRCKNKYSRRSVPLSNAIDNNEKMSTTKSNHLSPNLVPFKLSEDKIQTILPNFSENKSRLEDYRGTTFKPDEREKRILSVKLTQSSFDTSHISNESNSKKENMQKGEKSFKMAEKELFDIVFNQGTVHKETSKKPESASMSRSNSNTNENEHRKTIKEKSQMKSSEDLSNISCFHDITLPEKKSGNDELEDVTLDPNSLRKEQFDDSDVNSKKMSYSSTEKNGKRKPRHAEQSPKDSDDCPLTVFKNEMEVKSPHSPSSSVHMQTIEISEYVSEKIGDILPLNLHHDKIVEKAYEGGRRQGTISSRTRPRKTGRTKTKTSKVLEKNESHSLDFSDEVFRYPTGTIDAVMVTEKISENVSHQMKDDIPLNFQRTANNSLPSSCDSTTISKTSNNIKTCRNDAILPYIQSEKLEKEKDMDFIPPSPHSSTESDMKGDNRKDRNSGGFEANTSDLSVANGEEFKKVFSEIPLPRSDHSNNIDGMKNDVLHSPSNEIDVQEQDSDILTRSHSPANSQEMEGFENIVHEDDSVSSTDPLTVEKNDTFQCSDYNKSEVNQGNRGDIKVNISYPRKGNNNIEYDEGSLGIPLQSHPDSLANEESIPEENSSPFIVDDEGPEISISVPSNETCVGTPTSSTNLTIGIIPDQVILAMKNDYINNSNILSENICDEVIEKNELSDIDSRSLSYIGNNENMNTGVSEEAPIDISLSDDISISLSKSVNNTTIENTLEKVIEGDSSPSNLDECISRDLLVNSGVQSPEYSGEQIIGNSRSSGFSDSFDEKPAEHVIENVQDTNEAVVKKEKQEDPNVILINKSSSQIGSIRKKALRKRKITEIHEEKSIDSSVAVPQYLPATDKIVQKKKYLGMNIRRKRDEGEESLGSSKKRSKCRTQFSNRSEIMKNKPAISSESSKECNYGLAVEDKETSFSSSQLTTNEKEYTIPTESSIFSYLSESASELENISELNDKRETTVDFLGLKIDLPNASSSECENVSINHDRGHTDNDSLSSQTDISRESASKCGNVTSTHASEETCNDSIGFKISTGSKEPHDVHNEESVETIQNESFDVIHQKSSEDAPKSMEKRTSEDVTTLDCLNIICDPSKTIVDGTSTKQSISNIENMTVYESEVERAAIIVHSQSDSSAVISTIANENRGAINTKECDGFDRITISKNITEENDSPARDHSPISDKANSCPTVEQSNFECIYNQAEHPEIVTDQSAETIGAAKIPGEDILAVVDTAENAISSRKRERIVLDEEFMPKESIVEVFETVENENHEITGCRIGVYDHYNEICSPGNVAEKPAENDNAADRRINVHVNRTKSPECNSFFVSGKRERLNSFEYIMNHSIERRGNMCSDSIVEPESTVDFSQLREKDNFFTTISPMSSDSIVDFRRKDIPTVRPEQQPNVSNIHITDDAVTTFDKLQMDIGDSTPSCQLDSKEDIIKLDIPEIDTEVVVSSDESSRLQSKVGLVPHVFSSSEEVIPLHKLGNFDEQMHNPEDKPHSDCFSCLPNKILESRLKGPSGPQGEVVPYMGVSTSTSTKSATPCVNDPDNLSETCMYLEKLNGTSSIQVQTSSVTSINISHNDELMHTSRLHNTSNYMDNSSLNHAYSASQNSDLAANSRLSNMSSLTSRGVSVFSEITTITSRESMLVFNKQGRAAADIPMDAVCTRQSMNQVQISRSSRFIGRVSGTRNEISGIPEDKNSWTEIQGSNDEDHNYSSADPVIGGSIGGEDNYSKSLTEFTPKLPPNDSLLPLEFRDIIPDDYKLNEFNESTIKNLSMIATHFKEYDIFDESNDRKESEYTAENTVNSRHMGPWQQIIENDSSQQKVMVVPNDQCLTPYFSMSNNVISESAVISPRLEESNDKRELDCTDESSLNSPLAGHWQQIIENDNCSQKVLVVPNDQCLTPLFTISHSDIFNSFSEADYCSPETSIKSGDMNNKKSNLTYDSSVDHSCSVSKSVIAETDGKDSSIASSPKHIASVKSEKPKKSQQKSEQSQDVFLPTRKYSRTCPAKWTRNTNSQLVSNQKTSSQITKSSSSELSSPTQAISTDNLLKLPLRKAVDSEPVVQKSSDSVKKSQPDVVSSNSGSSKIGSTHNSPNFPKSSPLISDTSHPVPSFPEITHDSPNLPKSSPLISDISHPFPSLPEKITPSLCKKQDLHNFNLNEKMNKQERTTSLILNNILCSAPITPISRNVRHVLAPRPKFSNSHVQSPEESKRKRPSESLNPKKSRIEETSEPVNKVPSPVFDVVKMDIAESVKLRKRAATNLYSTQCSTPTKAKRKRTPPTSSTRKPIPTDQLAVKTYLGQGGPVTVTTESEYSLRIRLKVTGKSANRKSSDYSIDKILSTQDESSASTKRSSSTVDEKHAKVRKFDSAMTSSKDELFDRLKDEGPVNVLFSNKSYDKFHDREARSTHRTKEVPPSPREEPNRIPASSVTNRRDVQKEIPRDFKGRGSGNHRDYPYSGHTSERSSGHHFQPHEPARTGSVNQSSHYPGHNSSNPTNANRSHPKQYPVRPEPFRSYPTAAPAASHHSPFSRSRDSKVPKWIKKFDKRVDVNVWEHTGGLAQFIPRRDFSGQK